MRLAFRIALRFLMSNKGQTALIALGIAIGISVQIFIGSLIEGLQVDLLETTIGSASHITVESEEQNGSIDGYRDIEKTLEENFESVISLSPTITKGAFLEIEDKYQQILFRGFELEKADEIYKLKDALLENSRLPGENEVLLGSALAEENEIKVGDTVSINTPENKVFEVMVSGLIDLKVAAINESWMVGSLDLAKTVFDIGPSEATALEMQLEDPFEADEISEQMVLELGREDIAITNWKLSNEQLLSGLTGQSTSSLIIQIFVVISVVLGIASVLAITVLQKSKQIGIMKAMGIKDGTASLVFLMQGFMLGIIGGIMGIALGVGLLFIFSTFALSPDGTPVVPIFINPGFIAISGLIAVSASTAASIIPALKSKKLSPIEVIRNG